MLLHIPLDTYQWQWRNCNAVFESSRQLRAFPSNIGHQQLLSTWEVWHFEASDPTFRACNVQCPHGSSSRLLQVHELLFPILLQADANPLPNPAHWRVFSEWAWLELLVDKWSVHTSWYRYAVFRWHFPRDIKSITEIKLTFHKSLSGAWFFRHLCSLLFLQQECSRWNSRYELRSYCIEYESHSSYCRYEAAMKLVGMKILLYWDEIHTAVFAVCSWCS